MKTQKFKFLTAVLALLMALALLAGCANSPDDGYNGAYYNGIDENGDEYAEITEKGFTSVQTQPQSFFSMDVNTAAYSQIRRLLQEGKSVPKDIVRIEEMLNYFKFDYSDPSADEAMSLNASVTPCPWNTENFLLNIGVKTESIELSDVKNNLVFLIDVSGSMNSPDRLPLVRQSLTLLTEQLNSNDKVSIVTYASGVKKVLSGESGGNKRTIVSAIEELTAGGSTSGSGGIQLAYRTAQENFIEGGNNRVILATDGDFNVGISSESELKAFISEKRDTGVYLSVFGFGLGNLKDNKLEALASSGNGNYGYIGTLNEAKKVFVEEIGGTLKTVAKDCKAGVLFNGDAVEEYRLIGYDNKSLTFEQWNDSATDAGELGAGRCFTAVYEIKLAQNYTQGTGIAKVSVKYKDPIVNTDMEKTTYVSETKSANEDELFISAVVEFGLVLRNSAYKANASAVSAKQRILGLACTISDPYKAEFLAMLNFSI